ncbi:sugar phosphate isomerase/epimerase [Halobacillus salinarum]|uniref:Sugar phosphate isomerase/epimerase n=1 Tax=Halobacillus salinarum TaxID=2932257 RepID=A0ABY4EHQ6_9BACI|nr:sugar phosphate isomerase/epimerase [Halobacillus salinarum]UOQ43602.1 sugar phosphate isomerase/epimerase [Halobacillus salinarum]
MSKMGLQLYSIKEEVEQDFLGTISKVADLGYEGVQFAGFFETPAEELRTLLDQKSIEPAGAHISIDLLRGAQLQETLEYNREINNSLIICPFLPENMRQNAEDYKNVADLLNNIGERCNKAGFTFAYHNHAFEFEPQGASTGFEIIWNNTDPEYVKMELDCFWALYAGHDPNELIQTYGDRIISLHIKDITKKGNQQISTEIGQGNLDIAEIINTSKNNEVEWMIVEQEHYEMDQMESSKVNAENLKELLTAK